MPRDPFYRFRSVADDESVAEILVSDFIGDWIDGYFGFGVTAKAFISDLKSLPDSVRTIRVRINSPGGDTFAALQIANALRSQRVEKGRTVETYVDGLAASAASVILMAGDPVRIADNGVVMIHNPWSGARGDAAEMRKIAEVLDTVRDSLVATYRWHSELSEDEIVGLMEAETWMDAAEAVENGFATEIVEGLDGAIAASVVDPRGAEFIASERIPERFRERVAGWIQTTTEANDPEPAPGPEPASDPEPEPTPAPEPEPEPEPEPTPEPAPEPPASAAAAVEVLRLCRARNVLDLAESLIERQASTAEVEAAVNREAERRAAQATREREIRALCATAGLEEIADGYVDGGMPVAGVRAQILALTARLESAEVNTGLGPDHGARRKPRIDARAWYAELNGRRLPAAQES